MQNSILLPCDGCGQLAGTSHIARRLQRLQWATRFRPVHIHSLILGGIAPEQDSSFLYAPESPFDGEARALLQAVQLSTEGKSRETILTEFQKLGLLLTHLLECPLEQGITQSQSLALLEKQLPSAIARIRRSLKPKRLLLISADLPPLAGKLLLSNLGCPILPSPSGAFLTSPSPSESEFQAFRAALAPSNARET